MRVWHKDRFTPSPVFPRTFGPLHRFDPHEPDAVGRPQESPSHRSTVYVAVDLKTALAEVFGDMPEAPICPRYRVSLLVPKVDHVSQDLRGDGCMQIGARPSLCTGDLPRVETQAWGRAIFEDRPGDSRVGGAVYSSAHNQAHCQVVFNTGAELIAVPGDKFPVDGLPLADAAVKARVQHGLRELRIRAAWIRLADCVLCRRAASSR